MKIGLFIPCFIDQFYPEVGKISYKLLLKLGHQVEVATNIQCCGQPLANGGYEHKAKGLYQDFVNAYNKYDLVVMPSGSCTYHISHHYTNIVQDSSTIKVRNTVIDICDFLIKYEMDNLPTIDFPHQIALHTGCHSLRGLRFGESSELVSSPKLNIEHLLTFARGHNLTTLDRPDECCGFGGTFATTEAAISVKMGQDKINDIKTQKADYILTNDMSCIMHLQGIIDNEGGRLKTMHIIELFKDYVNE